jgi:hypothetical protein
VAVELHVHAERGGIALDPAALSAQRRSYRAALGEAARADQDEQMEMPLGESTEVLGVPQSLEQKRAVSPSSTPLSIEAGSPHPCDDDGSGVLGPACFSAKRPGDEHWIPAIILILTGIVGRVCGGERQPGRGVVRSNLITGWTLAYVSAPMIVLPQEGPRGGVEEGKGDRQANRTGNKKTEKEPAHQPRTQGRREILWSRIGSAWHKARSGFGAGRPCCSNGWALLQSRLKRGVLRRAGR